MANTTNTRVKVPDFTGASCQPAQYLAFMTGATSNSPKEGGLIRFATWNVLTLNGTSYQKVLTNELAKYNLAALGITEVHHCQNRWCRGTLSLHSYCMLGFSTDGAMYHLSSPTPTQKAATPRKQTLSIISLPPHYSQCPNTTNCSSSAT